LVLGGLVVIHLFFPNIFTNKAEATAVDVRSWLSSLEDDHLMGDDLEQTVANFLAAGEAPFDLQALGKSARKQLDQDQMSLGDDVAFARLGFLEDEDYDRLAREDEDYERLDREGAIDKLLTSKEGHPSVSSIEFAVLDRLRLGSFTSEERTLIADKAIALLNPADEFDGRAAVNIVRILDHLGLAERSEELAPSIDRLLKATWIRGEHLYMACFATYDAGPYETEFRAQYRDDYGIRSGLWRESTSRSIWLMSRFGVPDWLGASDLGALDAFLRKESRYILGVKFRVHTRGPLDLRCSEAASARALLHTLPGWKAAEPKLSNDLRVLIASVLMAAFSVILTWRASQETPAA
jgi:hypothetical protein